MWTQIRNALILFCILTVLTGIGYPLLITLIAQTVFPYQANGSLIAVEGKYCGSELIGQQFDDPGYFWGRPSATQPLPYNAAASAGSNYGPTNRELLSSIQKRVDALKSFDADNDMPVPVDIVTCSGSGLDPDISLAAAWYQVPRIAQQRHISEEQVRSIVIRSTEDRQFGFLGEPRVNVLKLNLALDKIK
jgi:K+-transporting ATPase ATPase C chain